MKRIILSTVVCVLLILSGAAAEPVTAQPASLPPEPIAPVTLQKSWVKTWGGSGDDAAGIAVTDDAGNIYLAGSFSGTVDFDPDPLKASSYTSSNGTLDAYLSKFTPDGTFQWARTWGGSYLQGATWVGRDIAGSLVVDKNGDVYVSGPYQYTVDFDPGPGNSTYTSNGNGGSSNNIYLSKFSPAGQLIWVRTWGPADGGAESYSLALDRAGNILVEGDFSGTRVDFNPYGGHDWHDNHPRNQDKILFFDSFLTKISPDGTYQWTKTWGGTGYDDGPGVTADSQGNIYVAGMFGSTDADFDPDPNRVYPMSARASVSGASVDVFLSKFDQNGNFQWARSWGGQDVEDAGSLVKVDQAGNVYITGRFSCTGCDFDPGAVVDNRSSNGSLDVFISKFDPNGSLIWARTWGGPGWDAPGNLALDNWGHIYLSGFFNGQVNFNPDSPSGDTFTSQGMRDAFLTMLNVDGSYGWTKTWGSSADDSGWSVTVDRSSQVYVVGTYSQTVDFDPGSGTDTRTSSGGADAYLARYFVDLPFQVNLPEIRLR